VGTMFGLIVALSSLFVVVQSEFEDLKTEVFTVEKTGKWKGKADAHVPMLDIEPIKGKGGGWDGKMWTTHVLRDEHYIKWHWVEDGDGNLIYKHELGPTIGEDLDMDLNQTSVFTIPKGTKDPLTTYSWCTVHGTWAHTWNHVSLYQADEEEEKVDEHGKKIEEDEMNKDGMTYKKRSEVPQHPKVNPEALKEFKEKVFSVEAPGQWRGKSGEHVPMLDLHPVERGGGWVAELETSHGKDPTDFIMKHWVEDAAGKVLGVVDFGVEDEGETNKHGRQVSQFHVPRGAKEPLTTYAHCKQHGTWAHTWSTLPLEQHHGDDGEL